ncbi:hypothetical protein Bbelb_027870 [Branchiostoma belcheri]|nr:hypothetical protein Bbelb_027870 [Branchiostoma belcheri]
MAAANSMHLHPHMNWEADDPVEEFRKFKQKVELAFKSFLADTEEEQQVSYILLWTGSQGLDLFNSWGMTAEDAKKPDKVLKNFENHLEPKTNHRIFRYEFQGLKQESGETIDDFVSRLKNVAKKCKFKDAAEIDDRIIDQLVWGCAYHKVQKSLVWKADLTLKDAIDTARAFEATEKQMSSLSLKAGTPNARVDALSSRKQGTGSRKQPTNHAHKHGRRICRYCGIEHDFSDRKKCPAFGSSCNKCGKSNHWGKMCKSKAEIKPQHPRINYRNRHKQVHLQREEENSSEGESLSIGTIHMDEVRSNEDEAYTTMQITRQAERN